MTKVVINACFGGFSLSHEGCEHYAKLKEFKLYRYFDPIGLKVYGPERIHESTPHYTTEPVPSDEHGVYTDSDALNKHYWSCRDIARDDPALVETVEALGDRADGAYANLQVVEIPDGVEWEIDEYDGNEHVAEKHRMWR